MHCELRAVSDGILVKDLGSTNGTFVGTVRLREAVVSVATEITVGRTKVLLEPLAKRRVEVGYLDRFGSLVGASPKMRRVFGILEKVASTPLSVLIGRDRYGQRARSAWVPRREQPPRRPLRRRRLRAHSECPRREPPFRSRKGDVHRRDRAAEGSARRGPRRHLVSRRELGELPLDLQPKLCRRALQRGQIRRVGGSAFEPIDSRGPRRDPAGISSAPR